MDTILLMWAWIQANPWTTVAIVTYVIANLAPRPHRDRARVAAERALERLQGLLVLRLCQLWGVKYLWRLRDIALIFQFLGIGRFFL